MSKSNEHRRIVVTGATGGLGLAFTRRWLEAGHHVFALARTAGDQPDLKKLADSHRSVLHRMSCDVAEDTSVRKAAAAIAETWDGVDIALNNAGIYGPKDTSLEKLDLDAVRRVFEVNTLGPLRVTAALLPLLRKGTAPRMVHITSLMGSIADNTSGGSYPYRISKAALNMAARTMAHELTGDGIICAVLHPGWVRTNMGGEGAPLTVDESVPAMIQTIEGLTRSSSGGFFDRNGDRLPW